MIFWHKIVIIHGAIFLSAPPPLTWNPGFAPGMCASFSPLLRNIAYIFSYNVQVTYISFRRGRGRVVLLYLRSQYLSPLTLWVRIPIRRGVLDTTLSDKVCQSLASGWWFSPEYSDFSHQWNWPLWYNWNIVESDVKHHSPNPNPFRQGIFRLDYHKRMFSHVN